MKKEDFESANPGDLITVKLPLLAVDATHGLVSITVNNGKHGWVRFDDVIAIETAAPQAIKAGDKVVCIDMIADERVYTVVHVERQTARVKHPAGVSCFHRISCLAKVADDVQVRPKCEIEVGCHVRIRGSVASDTYWVLAVDDGDVWVRNLDDGDKHTARLAAMERVD